MSPGDGAGRPPDRLQSLERGLAVIKAFGADAPQLTLSEVAERTDLPRAAARRCLLTLADLGYVRTDGRRFALTARIMELGYAYLSSLTLAELAGPHLEELAALTGESSSVSVLDGGDVVYVARVATSRIMRGAIAVGTRFPAYATSMGRVLLGTLDPEELDAYLTGTTFEPLTARTTTDCGKLRTEVERARRQGWAVVDQELEEGLRSAAAPIRGADGEVVAAVNLSTHAGRTTLDVLRETRVPQLLEAAERISADLRVSAPRAARA